MSPDSPSTGQGCACPGLIRLWQLLWGVRMRLTQGVLGAVLGAGMGSSGLAARGGEGSDFWAACGKDMALLGLLSKLWHPVPSSPALQCLARAALSPCTAFVGAAAQHILHPRGFILSCIHRDLSCPASTGIHPILHPQGFILSHIHRDLSHPASTEIHPVHSKPGSCGTGVPVEQGGEGTVRGAGLFPPSQDSGWKGAQQD